LEKIAKERIKELDHFQKMISVKFKDPKLLQLALTHKSFVREKGTDSKELNVNTFNERLEFFGDAVLKLVVSEFLMAAYPAEAEGELTKLRAAIISDSTLAKIAKNKNIGNYLLMSSNERKTGGATRKSNVANALEALIGAIYLDRGLESTKKFIVDFVKSEITHIVENSIYCDYKSTLQELVQSYGWNLPEYRVINEKGPDHDKLFSVQVKVGKRLKRWKTTGTGKTKKEAEQSAAHHMLQKVQENN
jgi:ribonuclease III